VFGIDLRPGLAEALTEPVIHVTKTSVKHLFVLPAGNMLRMGISPDSGRDKHPRSTGSVSQSGLMFLPNFRDVLYSLQQEFGFVILDMASANDAAMPMIFAQQMNGLLVVIDTNRTTKEHVDYVIHRFGADRVRGFVLNRVPSSG
jgi:Mrp family chromosome partitioning ATPase